MPGSLFLTVPSNNQRLTSLLLSLSSSWRHAHLSYRLVVAPRPSQLEEKGVLRPKNMNVHFAASLLDSPFREPQAVTEASELPLQRAMWTQARAMGHEGAGAT